MPESHPTSHQLEQFFRGSLDGEATGRIVRHLLAGCRRCGSAAAAHWPPPRPSAARLDASFGGARDDLRRQSGSLAAERVAAPGLLKEVRAHPAARQMVLARNSRRFQSWPLTELVLEHAFEAGYDDVQEALELAELGVVLADALQESARPVRLVTDLRARAYATRGNAKRIQGDLAAAGTDLERASELVAEGTGDPLEEAFVLLRVAYLRGGQRRFDESVRSFDRAIALFRLVGDGHWVGRTLIDKGRVCGQAGNPDLAIQLIEHGLESLDPARDPRMVLAAKHNLALFRCESGDLDRATALVKELLPLHAARRERINMLRLRWLEGKLAQAQERWPQAEEAFLEVQREFVDRELGFDAALVTLDLAVIYLEQGRAGDLKQLCSQVVPIFQTLAIHREALVALTLFQRAVEMQEISLRWIFELSAYLERARNDPELRFRPPRPPRTSG